MASAKNGNERAAMIEPAMTPYMLNETVAIVTTERVWTHFVSYNKNKN